MPPLFFAAAGDFFAGQGDRNTKKCHLLLPYPSARRQKRHRRRGKDLGAGDKNGGKCHILSPTSKEMAFGHRESKRPLTLPSPRVGGEGIRGSVPFVSRGALAKSAALFSSGGKFVP